MNTSLNRQLLLTSLVIAVVASLLTLLGLTAVRSVRLAIEQLSQQFNQAQLFSEYSSQIDQAGNQSALFIASGDAARLEAAHLALDRAQSVQDALNQSLVQLSTLSGSSVAPDSLVQLRSLIERQDRLLNNVRLNVADARRFGSQSGVIDQERMLERSLSYQEAAHQLRLEVQAYLDQNLQSARERVFNTVLITGAAILTALLGFLGLILMANLLLRRRVVGPVTDLAQAASRVALGDLQARPTGRYRGELADLSEAFNLMTGQLTDLVGELEQRVDARTRELAERTRYLETSAEIGRAAASILDPAELLAQAASLIAESFGLYYVGIFLVDAERQWAVLQAGSGIAGQAMLARHHRLPLPASSASAGGQTMAPFAAASGSSTATTSAGRIAADSMIGWCISNNQPRIAQEADADYVRRPAPELPDTRSEVALPLRSRGQVIGAISAQSTRSNAFDAAILSVLQSMADQLAVAIDNARLFAQSQVALEAERRLYALRSQEDWQVFTNLQQSYFYRGTPEGVTRQHAASPEMDGLWQQPEVRRALAENGPAAHRDRLALPIVVRGSVIGMLDVQAAPGKAAPSTAAGSAWSTDELAFLNAVTEQLGVALDSARLYAETQQKAAQERLASEITARMRESLDVEAVLQTALEEISRALNVDDLTIELTSAASEATSAASAATSGRARAAAPFADTWPELKPQAKRP